MSATHPFSMHSLMRASVQQCRAYCGPAHGQSWTIEAGATPPAAVKMSADPQVVYRLIYRLDNGQPALDHLGNYLYMPVLFSTSRNPAQRNSDTVHLVDVSGPHQCELPATSMTGRGRPVFDLLLLRPWRQVRQALKDSGGLSIRRGEPRRPTGPAVHANKTRT